MHDWLQHLLDFPTPLGVLSIVGRTVAVYVFLVLGLRLMGKRQLGQMNLYDLVLVIVLANAVQNSMLGNDVTLVGGLIAAAVLLGMNKVLGLLIMRSPSIESHMVGDPLVIVQDGVPLTVPMRKEGITTDQLMAAMREHGMTDMAKVQLAVLEVDGTISIVPASASIKKSRRHYKGLRLS